MAMRVLLGMMLLVPSVVFCGELTLVEDGKSSWRIALPSSASLVEQTASRELSDHLFQVTGARLPIVAEDGRVERTIFIGDVSSLPKVDVSRPDTIVILSSRDSLYLSGHPRRGPLYAVYTFLEDLVGVRWWTSTESTIPRRPTLRIPAQKVVYYPKLLSRETYYGDALEGVFSARLKNNGHMTSVTEAYGGHMSLIGWCHTFAQFLPAEKYFKEHPDWYPLIDGRRQAGGHLDFQLCLTNEEMTQEFIRICLEKIRANRQAGIISVSQNDAFTPKACQCEKCVAILKENGNAQSGPLIYFVNKVAEAVEKEFPEFLVETLAYQHTMTPPTKIQPRHNVVIRLCTAVNATQSIRNGPDNRRMKQLLESWGRIAPKLYVWHYLANFHNYMIPYPNYRHFDDDIRLFIENNAVGLFAQGDKFCSAGDFVRARAWILAHLQWNPELKADDLYREFFRGYYGAAGDTLLSYLELLSDAALKSGHRLSTSGRIPPVWMSTEVLREGYALFDRALALVKDDPVIWDRVRRERIPLDVVAVNVHIKSLRQLRFEGAKESEVFLLQDAKQMIDDLMDLVAKWKIEYISEGGRLGGYISRMYDNLSKGQPIAPAECEGLPEHRWDAFQENRFRLAGPGEWAFLVDDPAASNGKAVYMKGDDKEWAVQVPLMQYPTNRPWVFYYAVRCEGNADDGAAFAFGVHSQVTGASQGTTTHLVSECKGKTYKLFKSKPIDLKGDEYVWFAPPARPRDQVDKIYFDQVYMIQEEMPVPKEH